MTVTATDLNVVLEGLLDRTACLVPFVQTITTLGASTWAKPALAVAFEIEVVGAGGGGAGFGAGGGTGGGGGGAGELVRWQGSAALLPSTFYLYVGEGGFGGDSGAIGVSGEDSWISDNATPSSGTLYVRAYGGEGAINSTYAPSGRPTGAPDPIRGRGGSGTATSGNAGQAGVGHGAGGRGGTHTGTYPRGGRGYGAGGCGGTSFGNGGGGGGGGGYGGGDHAEIIASDGPGGNGANGVIVITWWCGIDLR